MGINAPEKWPGYPEKTPGTFSASFEKRRIWDLRFKLNWINLSTKELTPGSDPWLGPKSNNFSQPLERARCGGKVCTVKPVTLEVFSDYV
jgi:hypothetical protein